MPKLSMYRPVKTADYKFFDRTIAEQYRVGGVDIFCHKYAGPKENPTNSGNDATIPTYVDPTALDIQDLLLLENRDRRYEKDIYVMRGIYQESDIDFNLTQFGLFLNGDTKFITFHYKDMIDTFGRKLMSGDVLEFPNLQDYNPLDTKIQKALPRYYVVQEGNFGAEGFSQTWLPHLWRVKCTPMAASQEYDDILKQVMLPDNIWDPGNFYPAGSVVESCGQYYTASANIEPGVDITDPRWQQTDAPTVLDQDTARNRDLQSNDAILIQAKVEVPLSGYNTESYYVLPTYADGQPAPDTNTNLWQVTTDSVLVSNKGYILIPQLDYVVTGGNTLTYSVTQSTGSVNYVRCINLSAPNTVFSEYYIAPGGTRQFTLANNATTTSILVTWGGLTLRPDTDYQIEPGNVISFTRVIPQNTKIEVLYLDVNNPSNVLSESITTNPNYSKYNLTYSGIENELIVTVNGTLLTPSIDYTVVSNTITFKTLPNRPQNVNIRYIHDPAIDHTNVLLQTITTEAGVDTYSIHNLGNEVTPTSNGYLLGYLTGDGKAPNGLPVTDYPLPAGSLPVTPGVSFPPNPAVGDYCLRLDYFPNRLFRFNGKAWIFFEQNVRTDMYLNNGADTQRAGFVNNTYTTATKDMGNIPQRQSLTEALRPDASNGDQGGFLPPNPPGPTQPGQPSTPSP